MQCKPATNFFIYFCKFLNQENQFQRFHRYSMALISVLTKFQVLVNFQNAKVKWKWIRLTLTVRAFWYLYVCGGANCAHTFFRVKVILRKFISLKFEASLKAQLNGFKLQCTYILSLVTGDLLTFLLSYPRSFKRSKTLFISWFFWAGLKNELAGCRSTLSMLKIKVKISETKFLSFYKTLRGTQTC